MIPEDDLEDIFARTAPLWDDIRGQRIFLTGGTGLFGKWLIASFLQINDRLNLGASLCVLSRNPPNTLQPALTWMQGDVRDFTFPKGRFSHIIHAATTSADETWRGELPLSKIDTVVGGTRRVLEFAAQCGATRFLLTSSGNAYGSMLSGHHAFREDDLCGPNLAHPEASTLGESKRMAELLTRIFAQTHGFEAKICRCFTFIGPHLPLDIHYAMGNFIRDALSGGPVVVRGDGLPIRSWMYLSDLTVWLWTLLFRGVPNRLYNVGSDEVISVGEAAHRVAAITGTTVQFQNAPEIRATASPNVYIPDTHRIRNELGVESTVDLDAAIRKTLVFYEHENSGVPNRMKPANPSDFLIAI